MDSGSGHFSSKDHSVPVSFCISTYKRPEFLRKQLSVLAAQTFRHFKVIISDNDIERSAEQVVSEFNDERVSYYNNDGNIGMVRSFNNSLFKADTEFVVMITDDDPVTPNMLEVLLALQTEYPGYSIYCGFKRKNRRKGEVEILSSSDFLFEILDPDLTENILWSSCIMRRSDVVELGGFPDYGSPHLADHLMIGQCGALRGGVVINEMFGSLSTHDENFSKTNFDLYFLGCVNFYSEIKKRFSDESFIRGHQNALKKHLEAWFIGTTFNLKYYFTFRNYSEKDLKEVDSLAKRILQLDFMRGACYRYFRKSVIFRIKRLLFALKF